MAEDYEKDFKKKIDKYKQAFDEIDLIVGGNLCDDDCDVCPANCECDWKKIQDIIKRG